MTCDGVNIRDIEPLKRRSKTLGVKGRADVMFGGEIRFSERLRFECIRRLFRN